MLTQARMDYVADVALLPFALLINFSLFQYLMGLFFNRRAQPLTLLLLLCAFLGVAGMVPFSIPDDRVFSYLNDVSETASTLTFLVQIVILGRDICKKVKIKSLVYITMVSQVIIFIECLLIVLTLFKIADEKFHVPWLDDVDKIAQSVALWFIFVFRFYYISMARGGFCKTLRTRKVEILLYLLFATNEYAFAILSWLTEVDWDSMQACWHRLTLMLCIVYTIHDKHKSSGTSNRTTRGAKSHGALTRTPSKLHTVGPLEVPSTADRPVSTTKTSKSQSLRGPSWRGFARFSTSFRRRQSVRPSPSPDDLHKTRPPKIL